MACETSNKMEFKKFQSEFNLIGQVVESEQFFKMGMVDIYDSLLIITNPPENPRIIHIFNKNSHEFIGSAGKIGKGPSEINVPGLSCIDKVNGNIWIRDMGLQKMFKFPIAAILSNPNFMPTESVAIPDGKFFISFRTTPQGNFSFSNPDQKIFISFFNTNGKWLKDKDIPDKLQENGKVDEKNRMYSANYLYTEHPDGDKWIIAYRFKDILAVIDSMGELKWKIQGPDRINQVPNIDNQSIRSTYEQIVCNGKFIFGLYSGLKKIESKDGEIFYNYPRKIHVFDLNGNPFALINLTHSVVWFDYDYEFNRIVTFSPETGGVVYYALPETLKIINK